MAPAARVSICREMNVRNPEKSASVFATYGRRLKLLLAKRSAFFMLPRPIEQSPPITSFLGGIREANIRFTVHNDIAGRLSPSSGQKGKANRGEHYWLR